MGNPMQLVVDTNVIISALLAKSRTFELIVLGDLDLFVPDYSLQEIENHSEELVGRMGVSKEEFSLVLGIILSHVTVVNRQSYTKFESHAKNICPDPDDFAFFALALSMKIPLWTNDAKLKKQNEIRIYNTKDLIELLI